MAIFLVGVTVCPLCQQLVSRSDDVVNFPPIFLNQHHDVFEITDSVVHRSCLRDSGYGQLALDKLSAYEARRSRPKVCAICGQVIANPDEYFGTGPLSDESHEAVARLDWFEVHVECVAAWDGTPQLIRDLLQASDSDDWEGPVLRDLADRLQLIVSGRRNS